MIDVLTESLFGLTHARKIKALWRNGKRPQLSAVYRWAQRGATAANGEMIRLETVRTPNGLKTSEEAIVRFIAKLTNPDSEPDTLTDKQRRIMLEASERELEAMGVK